MESEPAQSATARGATAAGASAGRAAAAAANASGTASLAQQLHGSQRPRAESDASAGYGHDHHRHASGVNMGHGGNSGSHSSRSSATSTPGTPGTPRASMKAALADPRLSSSLKDASPRNKAHHDPRNTARIEFEKRVSRYYCQLSTGCGDPTCNHKLCASCPVGPRLTQDAAAIMAVQLASRPRVFFCPRIPLEPQVSFPETLSLSPFATPRASPRGSPLASPAHSRASSTHDLTATGATLNTASGNSGGSGSGSGYAGGVFGAISSFLTGSASGSASNAAAADTPMDRQSDMQPQPARPFLHSLLSASPFASLFQSTAPDAANDATLAQQRPSDALPNTGSDHLPRSTSSGALASSRTSLANGTQPSITSSASLLGAAARPYAPIASSRLATVAPTTSLSPQSDAAPSAAHQPATTTPDAANTGSSLLAPNTPDPSAPRSRSFLDLPSLVSATANLQSAVWGGIAKAGDNVSDSIPGTPPSESAGVHDADAFTDSGPSSPVPEPAGQALALDETAADEEQQLMLNHLTLTLLEHAVATYTSTFPDNGPASPTSPSSSSGSNASATGDATFLVNTLRNVFSSVSSLSRSFLAEGSVVTNSSKLDIPSLRKSYHIILQLSPSSMFQTVLANALELLLAKLLLDTSKLHHAGPDLLRVVLILMENPLLLDPAYHESLLRKLSLVLGSIRTKSRTVLIRWLSQYDTAGFEKIIRVFQQYVVDHVYSGSSKLDESLIGAVKALSMLSHANESTSRKPITPHTTFQMPNLAQKLNFKEEYRTWRRSMQGSTSNGSGTGTVTEFSFFNFPFLLDPIAKTRILHIDARVQMSLVYEDAYVNQALMQHAQRFLVDSPRASNLEQEMKQKTNPFLVLEIRRERLVDDVLDQITKKEVDLKKPLKIRFVCGGEEGQDQGGVQKEFFQVLVSRLLDPSYGMFVYDEETRSSWINGASLEPERQFELVGIIIGLALYNGVMLGIHLPLLLYKKLLDVRPTFDDFKEAFPTLGRGLQQLLDWTDGDVYDVFMRSFEISYEVYGQVRTLPLVANGADIPVTNANRVEYVQLYVQHYTDEFIRRPFRAFRAGFHKVVGGEALKLCRPDELELLICGTMMTDLDFGELQRAAEYDDGYSPDHPVMVWFWDIVHAMTLEQKKQLLNFVTASDRVPLKGLGNLVFVVQRNGPDSDRLPTALTCFGRLLLPEYESKEKLANRLTTAIENAKGFGLV